MAKTAAQWQEEIDALRGFYSRKATFELYMRLDHAIKMHAGACLRERKS